MNGELSHPKDEVSGFKASPGKKKQDAADAKALEVYTHVVYQEIKG